MAYTITSDRLDCPKAEGETITDQELLAMGVDIQALVEGGHITPDGTAPASVPAPTPVAPDTAPAGQAESTPSSIIAEVSADATTQEGAK